MHNWPADPVPTLRALQGQARVAPLPPRVFNQLHALLLTSGRARHSPHLALLLRLCPASLFPLSHRLRLLLRSPLPPTTFLANSLLLASPPPLHLPSALALYSLLFLLPPSSSPLRPNAYTYPPLLRAAPPPAARALATHSLKFLGDQAAACDRVLAAALLDVFARCGRIHSCRRVFDRIDRPDLPAWNALLSAYARRARDLACADSAGEVLHLFTRLMSSSSLIPNEITFVAVVGASGELGALGHGVWAHAYVLRHQLAVNCFVATTLVEMYARCGRLDLAEQVFFTADRDTRCYNTMLHALAIHGRGRAALALFDRMCHEGVVVDCVTMLAVMCACAHAGLVDEGLHCLERMEDEFGIVPRIEHYGCLVDMLSRAGQLEDAEKVIQGMGAAPNAAMYRSLIMASGVHGKLELGERMIRQLMELEPEHSGNYVMLSNFYARMSRWEDAKKARQGMKAMGIDKSPGSSLLDIDGVLHEFLMGDKTHPSSTQIYAMVEEIEARLREYGHRLSTAVMLFDVEEEDKEDALSYHSERLDVAYSPPGPTIRIIKNLQVCSDCHELQSLSPGYMEEISS
jgi:pentatricopeptide repeat protein